MTVAASGWCRVGRLFWLGPLFMALALGACGGGQDDLDSYIAGVNARPGKAPPELPPVKTPVAHQYTAADRRDPFSGGVELLVEAREPLVKGTGSGIQPPDRPRREALERFELDSLEMVGTLEMDDQLYGLVTDPDGLVHRVQTDNYVGRNYGQIREIHDDRIEIQETIPDGEDSWRHREVSLALDDS